jgi:asparagine synthase (glutamine-hydrolysing)
MYHPYHHPAVQRLAACIPTAYRLIPYRGRKVTKPVLRLAYADDLPPLVIRYRGGVWTSAPHQEYCLNHTSYLERLLGTPEAQVVQRDIIDPVQLVQVLQNRQQIRRFASILIATAMTELFLRQCLS